MGTGHDTLANKIPVSIVVPVYNSEQYLKLSVGSILAQTFTDFELILVDDGSTDNSGVICEEYSKTDSRIVVLHTENRGSAMARNVGLDIAKGQYIAFIDSDDYVDPNYIKELYDIIIDYDADIAFHDYYWFYVDSDITPEWHGKGHKDATHIVYTRDEIIIELCNHYCTNLINPSKMFKREIFTGLRFPNVRKNDDEWLVHHYFLKSKKLVYTDSQYYFYRFSPESQTRGMVSKDSFSAVLALTDRIDTLKMAGYETNMAKLYELFFFSTMRFYNKCNESSINVGKEIKSIRNYLKDAYNKAGFKNMKDTFSKKDLLSLYLFSHNFFIYKILPSKYKSSF